MSSLQKLVSHLDENQRKMSDQLDFMKNENDKTKEENIILKKELIHLRASLSQNQWPTLQKENQTVVIGSSIAKHFDESKLVNTKIISKSGAKLDTIKKTMKSLPEKQVYDKLILIAGGNNVSETDSTLLSNVVTEYKGVIQEAKKHSRKVIVSGVPPRLNSVDFVSKIDTFNAQMQVAAEESNVEFVSQHDIFHLASQQVNDGYLDSDQIHPNIRGTNRMGERLGLVCKTAETFDVATRRC